MKQLKEYVVGILPQLLRKEPERLVSIEGIIAYEFPRRDEFSQANLLPQGTSVLMGEGLIDINGPYGQ